MVKWQKQHGVEFHSLAFPAPASQVSQSGFFFLVWFWGFYKSIHLASVFGLQLHSEQPVEFFVVVSLEASAVVDITYLCDLPPV